MQTIKIIGVENRLRRKRDGTHMQLQQKNNTCKYNTKILLLPITGALFLKKPVPVEPEESSLDFHLNMIKKIDVLVQEHDKEAPADEPAPSAAAHTIPPQPPAEPRPQLGRRLDHVEIDLPHIQESRFTKNRIIPEEFKTDLPFGIEPEFKFITSLDAIENALHIKPHHRDRIEIIDLGDFTTDDVSSHLTRPLPIATQNPRQKPTTKKQQSDTEKPTRTKKMEVIDTRTLDQKTYEDVFLTAMKQNEEIEKKSQIYYLNSKGRSDAKIKKMEFKQSYIPDDFEERAKKLKEKQQQEEQQKHELEEKIKKQLEKEQGKLSKLETKKTKVEEKKQVKKKEQREYKKEPLQPPAEQFTKKQLKEQKRLERIEARKAKIEERLKRKEEKKALKEQQKQQRLQHSKTDKKQKPAKEKKGGGLTLFKKTKTAIQSTELDDDIKKVLIMTDALLGELPKSVISRFAQSDDFELYERVLNKYKIK